MMDWLNVPMTRESQGSHRIDQSRDQPPVKRVGSVHWCAHAACAREEKKKKKKNDWEAREGRKDEPGIERGR